MLLKRIVLVVVSAALLSGHAFASVLSVSPTAGTSGVNRFHTSQHTPMSAAEITALTGYNTNTYGTLSMLYDAQSDPVKEDPAAFKDNYSTTFSPANDPKGFTIKWDGGAFINYSKVFLIVKDGAPGGTYVFDISPFAPGLATPDRWDGMMDIVGSNFFASGGGVSHVRIWGAGVQDNNFIPEPGTFLIWMLGMAGVAGVSMRRRRT